MNEYRKNRPVWFGAEQPCRIPLTGKPIKATVTKRGRVAPPCIRVTETPKPERKREPRTDADFRAVHRAEGKRAYRQLRNRKQLRSAQRDATPAVKDAA